MDKLVKVKWAVLYGVGWTLLSAISLLAYDVFKVLHTPAVQVPHDNGLGALFLYVFYTSTVAISALVLLIWVPLKFVLFAALFSGLFKLIFRSISYRNLFSIAVYAGTPWVVGSLLFNFWLLLGLSCVLYLVLCKSLRTV